MLPPPARTAYFSTARRPGVVLRVHVTRVLWPLIAAATDAVTLAMPLRWHRKFSAVRSAVSIPRAGPRIVAMTSPGETRLPSGLLTTMLRPGSINWKASTARSSPATTPGWRAASTVSA